MPNNLPTLLKRANHILRTFISSYSIPLLTFLIIIATLLFLGWRYSAWQAAAETLSTKDQITVENDALKTIAQVVGGSFFLITAYFTWRSARTAEKNLAVSQEGQITDRFNKAVANLGETDNLAKQLGGIYALERIARDSPKDHWTIMEVLTAYVREHAPRRKDQDPQPQDEQQHEQQHQETKRPPTDIQAILTVLGRRTTQHEEVVSTKDTHKRARLDLRQTDLAGSILSGANLTGAILWKANLTDATLWEANLTDAILANAILTRAILTHATLIDASPINADLTGANLEHANLRDTNIWKSNLTNANLTNANLTNAALWDANLTNANLTNTNLTDAILRDANLTNANLTDAILRGTILRGADLETAVGLSPTQIKGAITDQTTKLPASIKTS